eukprot:TRINITY_DN67241_c0_g1_i1.p1 TRINITY_DN67241_c0_g1~~TRINITY_DN67241_c0_g1_i1.p1  ORF type:complete len:194 (-),score=17.72 TRINITY_DN67241_c0_g1_i1:71-583(-)
MVVLPCRAVVSCLVALIMTASLTPVAGSAKLRRELAADLLAVFFPTNWTDGASFLVPKEIKGKSTPLVAAGISRHNHTAREGHLAGGDTSTRGNGTDPADDRSMKISSLPSEVVYSGNKSVNADWRCERGGACNQSAVLKRDDESFSRQKATPAMVPLYCSVAFFSGLMG